MGELLCMDLDGNGVPDDSDNCPDASNPDQADADEDRLGDDCDNGQFVTNAEQAEFESDGLGDACDEDDDSDGISDFANLCQATAL